MQQLPQELITKALALTGINREKMYEETNYGGRFSIENFCFYLLSPDFIEKYHELYPTTYSSFAVMLGFAHAIYEYQKGNDKLLFDLLSKI